MVVARTSDNHDSIRKANMQIFGKSHYTAIPYSVLRTAWKCIRVCFSVLLMTSIGGSNIEHKAVEHRCLQDCTRVVGDT